MIDNVPKDTFRAWNGRQRSLVGPSSVEIQESYEFVHVKRFFLLHTVVFSLQGEERLLLTGLCASVGLRIDHFCKKCIMEINSILLIFWDTLSEVIEVRVWHALENEAHDTVREL